MFFVNFIFMTHVFFPLNLWLTRENLAIHMVFERKEKYTMSNPTQKNGYYVGVFCKENVEKCESY